MTRKLWGCPAQPLFAPLFASAPPEGWQASDARQNPTFEATKRDPREKLGESSNSIQFLWRMASFKAAGSPVPQHAVPFQGNCCASGLPNWMGHERAVRATRLCGSDSIQVLRYPPIHLNIHIFHGVSHRKTTILQCNDHHPKQC